MAARFCCRFYTGMLCVDGYTYAASGTPRANEEFRTEKLVA